MRIIKGYNYEDGLDFFYPHKLYEYQYEQGKLSMIGLFYDREPQLGGRAIRFELTSPGEDVIRIKVNYQPGLAINLSELPVQDLLHNVVNFFEKKTIFVLQVVKLVLLLTKIHGKWILLLATK